MLIPIAIDAATDGYNYDSSIGELQDTLESVERRIQQNGWWQSLRTKTVVRTLS